jgi:hypothetical protein
MGTSGRQGIAFVSGKRRGAKRMAAGGLWTDATRYRWQTLEIGAKFMRGWAGNQSQFLLLNTLK